MCWTEVILKNHTIILCVLIDNKLHINIIHNDIILGCCAVNTFKSKIVIQRVWNCTRLARTLIIRNFMFCLIIYDLNIIIC